MNLSFADNGNATGGIFTVSANADTAAIYASRFAGTNASRPFTNMGSVVGNGTLSLDNTALPVGPYLVFARSATEQTAPTTIRVTDAVDALHYMCLDAVREYVMNLALPTVTTDPDGHVICKLPYRTDLELDLPDHIDCGVYYFPRSESYTPEDNIYDKVDYQVQVLLIRRHGRRLFAGLQEMLKVREIMGQSLSVCPLPDVEAVHTVIVQPGAVYLPEHWKLGYDCSTVVFRCLSEQKSGIV